VLNLLVSCKLRKMKHAKLRVLGLLVVRKHAVGDIKKVVLDDHYWGVAGGH